MTDDQVARDILKVARELVSSGGYVHILRTISGGDEVFSSVLNGRADNPTSGKSIGGMTEKAVRKNAQKWALDQGASLLEWERRDDGKPKLVKKWKLQFV